MMPPFGSTETAASDDDAVVAAVADQRLAAVTAAEKANELKAVKEALLLLKKNPSLNDKSPSAILQGLQGGDVDDESAEFNFKAYILRQGLEVIMKGKTEGKKESQEGANAAKAKELEETVKDLEERVDQLSGEIEKEKGDKETAQARVQELEKELEDEKSKRG